MGTAAKVVIGTIATIASAEEAKKLADENLDPDNWFRKMLDNTVGKANDAVVSGAESIAGFGNNAIAKLFKFMIPMIAKLDGVFGKMFGDDHFFGKMIAGFIPDGVGDILSASDMAKLRGTTVAEEQARKHMGEFKEFTSGDKNSAQYKEMDQLAKQQGFDSIDQARWAANSGFENCAEFRFLEKTPEAAKAKGVDQLIKEQIAAGKAEDGHDLAVKMGYKASDPHAPVVAVKEPPASPAAPLVAAAPSEKAPPATTPNPEATSEPKSEPKKKVSMITPPAERSKARMFFTPVDSDAGQSSLVASAKEPTPINRAPAARAPETGGTPRSGSRASISFMGPPGMTA